MTTKTNKEETSKEAGALTVKEEANVPATIQEQPFDDGLGEITNEDLIIPRLKIGQNQSPGDVAGKLFIDVTGDAVDEMEIVILRLKKSRVLFPEDFSRESVPLCRSSNFIAPDEIEDACTMADNCDDCAYSKWTKNEKGKSKPPRCSEVWNFLILDFDTFMPAWFSLKSTALKPARKIVSMIKLRGRSKRIPSWGYKTTLNVDTRSGDAGDSYIPAFSGLTELTGEDRGNMNSVQSQLSEEAVNLDVECADEAPAREDETDF